MFIFCHVAIPTAALYAVSSKEDIFRFYVILYHTRDTSDYYHTRMYYQ